MAGVRALPYSKAGGVLEKALSPEGLWTDVSENNCLIFFFFNRELYPRVSLRAILSRGGSG